MFIKIGLKGERPFYTYIYYQMIERTLFIKTNEKFSVKKVSTIALKVI